MFKILYSIMVPVVFFWNDLIYKYFLIKMKSITMCFKINIFNNNVKDNAYGQVHS